MSVPTRLRPVPLLVAAALLAGCGTTVQGAGRTGAAGGGGTNGLGNGLVGQGGSGQTLTGAGGNGGGSGGTSLGGSSGGGSVGGGVGANGTTQSGNGIGNGSGGTSNGVASGSSGPGVTATSIYVGLIYDKNAGAVNAAAGAGTISAGNTKANENAIIEDINKHGGVGGRQLVPVYANFDSESTQTLDQQYAAICQQFTQDNPRVFAVLGVGASNSESYRACIAKAGVTMLDEDLPVLDQAEFARYPGIIEQGYPNLDRLAAYQVTPLVEQNYFTPWNTLTGQPASGTPVKVGVITYDDVRFAPAVDNFLVPALKRLGYQPQVIKIAQINTAADYGSQGAAVKSAELSFASNGVTHIIPFESNGGLSELFLAAARSQNFYPRYGMSTASGFQALADTGLFDKKQFNGAIGYGWLPAVDLHSNYNPDNGPYSNASRRTCLAVMRAKGITFASSNAEIIALAECASLYLLKTVIDPIPAHVSLSTFVRAVESLGTTYLNPGGIGQDFQPGRHDPSNKAYHWRYFADCNCFHYEGPIHTVP